MKKIKLLVAAFAVMAFGALAVIPAGSVAALDPLADVCTTDPSNQVCQSQSDDANDLIGTLVNTLLFIVGTLSTVMIIVGGIFYATSNGDAGKVAKAKNTIMYSVVGLVVSLLAYAIVNWVVDIF